MSIKISKNKRMDEEAVIRLCENLTFGLKLAYTKKHKPLKTFKF